MGGRMARMSTGERPPQRSAWLAFTIITAFDFIIILFLWIVLLQQDKALGSSIAPSANASAHSFDFDIHTSTFDLVLISLVRSLVGIICYGLLRWISRLPMLIVTVASTAYIIGKVVVYNYSDESEIAVKDPLHIVLLFFILLSFIIMPWFTAFFFEFKYLSAEISQYERINWKSWKAWIWPRGLTRRHQGQTNGGYSGDNAENRALLSGVRNGSVESSTNPSPLLIPDQSGGPRRQYGATATPYLTPAGSVTDLSISPLIPALGASSGNSQAVARLNEVEERIHLSRQDMEYKATGEHLLSAVDQLLSPDATWKYEKEQEGVTCYSLMRNGVKLWRADRLYPFPLEFVWNVMYDDVELQTDWNTEITCNKIIHTIDECTDIVYTVTAPAVRGMVSPRDFVSLRVKVARPGQYMSLGTAVLHESKPPQPGIVRGENGTSAYVLMSEGENATRFLWIVQTDLKGWLPRYVIDQAVGGMMIQTHVKLLKYLQELNSSHTQ